MSYNEEVAKRLRVVVDKFGGTSAFARKLGKRPQALADYLSGKTLPGNKLRSEMRALGIDDNYIMYGTKQEQQKRFEANVMDMLRNAEPEKAKILDLCEERGIKTPAQLEQILNAFDAMKSMVLTERKAGYTPRKGKKL